MISRVNFALPADAPGGGGLGVAVQELLGRTLGTDFLVDYASASALTHHVDAYAQSPVLFQRLGIEWPVSTANPHPPTLLTLVLPFELVKYSHALAAWTLAMIFVLVATIRMVGLSWSLAVPIGVGLGLAMPGAYGISNPVLLIGFGVALAYRWHNEPFVAGLGIAIASAPKSSGLILVVPFLLARRFGTVAWAAICFAVMAAVPMLFQPDVWARYLDAGVQAIIFNQARPDNASLIHLGETLGLSSIAPLAVVGLAGVVLALLTRDTFWPTVWVMVVALPIAWMYSLLTFVPIGVLVFRRSGAVPIALVAAATGLTLAGPPLGRWPVAIFPIVTILIYVAMLIGPRLGDGDFWIPEPVEAILFRRPRAAYLPDSASDPINEPIPVGPGRDHGSNGDGSP